MASKECCEGSIHKGTSRGHEETLHTLQSYLTSPTNGPSKGIVVIIPDAFGWRFINLRLLADRYADRLGVQVVMPDFMGGNNLDPSHLGGVDTVTNPTIPMLSKLGSVFGVVGPLSAFSYKNRSAIARPRILSFFAALRNANPNTPIGSVGFCWGGYWSVHLARGTSIDFSGVTDAPPIKPVVDAVFGAHVSHTAPKADYEPLEMPTCLSQGTLDVVMDMKQIPQVQEIFAAKNKAVDGEEMFVVHVVEGATHGFAVRGDNDGIEEHARQAKLAEDHCVEFFDKWLLTKKGGKASL